MLDEDSNEFLFWNEKLREACEASGIKEESLPDLEKLEKNLFTFKLTFNRPIGLKADLVVNEIATLFMHMQMVNLTPVFMQRQMQSERSVLSQYLLVSQQ